MMKYFLFFIAVSLFFSNDALGQLGTITGHVHNRRENKALSFANVRLLSTNKRAITDANGNFKLDSIPAGTYDLNCFETTAGDTTFKIELTSNSNIAIQISLPPYCKYDFSVKNKTCPKCHKQDKVVPIVYGSPVGHMDKKHFYYAGCVVTYCDPHWYCKRDKQAF